MSNHDVQRPKVFGKSLSRRSMSTRILSAGLLIPAAGSLGAVDATAQATPDVSTKSDRVAINPGEMFSGAIVANGFVFTSGMLAVDPATGKLTGNDITAQTTQVLANLKATLTAAGSSMERVVKANCFLSDLADFQAFNQVYIQAFTSEPPARATVQVAALALGALVEIDLVALV